MEVEGIGCVPYRAAARVAVDELNDILHDLEPVLGPLSGPVTALEGGITNHNFRAKLGDGDYVIRIHGRRTELLGIDRRAELLASEAAAHLGIGPTVAATLEHCLVTRFLECSAVDSREVAERVEEIARALRAFHASGRLPARFWVPDLLDDYAGIVRRRSGTLPGAFAEAVAVAARIAHALPLRHPHPCHNDLLAGNILSALDDGRIVIVDWEYAGMGHPCFDLGNLSINNHFDQATDERLLAAYRHESPSRGVLAALKLMRVLSDAREAAWAVVQGAISDLDFDFERYGREHFARLHAAAAHADFDEWLATAEW